MEEEIKGKYCKHCGNISEKITRKTGLVFYRGICSTCNTKKKRKIPLEYDRDFLYDLHYTQDISLNDISAKLNIKKSWIEWLFKVYNIEEIQRCKHCGTKENLFVRPINNKFMNEPKLIVCDICKECYIKKVSESAIEAQKKVDKAATKRKYEQHYINDPEKKKKEAKKCSQTKNNKTPEEKQEIYKKFKATIENRTEEKQEEILSKCSFGQQNKKSTKLFVEIDKYFNGKYNFLYGLYDKKNRTFLKREKGISVKNLNLSNKKARFFDFYFINNLGQEVDIEFDEKAHELAKNKQDDIIREKELKIKKPNMIIFRIKEKYYDENLEKVFEDIINIIENPNCKTYYNYDCLLKQIEKGI